MLVTPAPDTHGVWNARRLVVQHMDARALRYPDEFFDGIFSSSAIEHFGTADDMAAAIAEMVRVLKPGGVLTLATELLIETESDAQGQGWEGVYLFTPETLDRLIVQPSGCALVGEVDLAVSPDTRATQMTLATATVEASQFTRPHIVFAHHGFIFTSVFLALVKPE
jgi:SAM-dependent methyltransferase